MARKPNPTQSPYLMGILGQFVVEATRTQSDAMPSQKEKEAWLVRHLRPGWKGHSTDVPLVGSMIKLIRRLMMNPTQCTFDIANLDRLCQMLGSHFEYTDFDSFSSFIKWVGDIPLGLNDDQLAQRGKDKAKKLHEQFLTQKKQNKDAAGRTFSLLFAIQENENSNSVGENSLEEAENRAEAEKNNIARLEELLAQCPSQVITENFLRQFNAAFFYGPYFVRNEKITPKLWQSAWIIDQYLEKETRLSDEMLWLRLDLKTNLMKISWALRKEEATQRLNRELLGLIEANKQRNCLEIKSLNPYYIDYYGYGCCFDIQRFEEFQHFTEQVDGSTREKQVHRWRSFKCTACTKLRCGQYEEVENTLAQMRTECNIIFEDVIYTKSMWAFYHYFLGGSQFHRKNYAQAAINLRLSLGFWEKLEIDNTLEAGYAYYLLSETERHLGQYIIAEQLLKKAKAIFAENKKINACSFDYEHIKNLLLEKTIR
ncbi:MAG: tetratricopeptide repeat protein [Spirosomataceae bacterium]